MIGNYTDIKYVIKVGELYLKSIGHKGVDFTTREAEARSFTEIEGIDDTPVVEQVHRVINHLFELGFRDTKVIELKTTVEHSEQQVQFQFILTPDLNSLRFIPVYTCKGEWK